MNAVRAWDGAMSQRRQPRLQRCWSYLWLAAMPVGGRQKSATIVPGSQTQVENFEAFFRSFERDIFGYLCRMTGEEQSAYDLSQETFLRAWQHFAQICTYDRPRAWLFRVATNLALNYLRRRPVEVDIAGIGDEDGQPASSDPAWRLAERDLVRQTLLELVPRQRAGLVLREVYGLSCEEVAQTLSVSRDAAKMLLCRAREQFRERYSRKEAGR
jgi:RNA polymerase sigma-70 factor, ECF subfamily